MTRTEAFEMAWKLEAKEKDFSIVDEIYHSDYQAVGSITGIEVNLAADKEVYLALIQHLILTPAKIVDEGEDFLRIERYTKYRETDIFMSGTTTITYKDGKIITQESVGEELDYDPAKARTGTGKTTSEAVGVLATNVISNQKHHKEGIE